MGCPGPLTGWFLRIAPEGAASFFISGFEVGSEPSCRRIILLRSIAAGREFGARSVLLSGDFPCRTVAFALVRGRSAVH